MKTLREAISHTVNELNKLLLKTQDEKEERNLRRLRRIYFDLWEEVIKREIDSSTPEFTEAIESLTTARDAAVEAKQDVEKIAAAIQRAASAAKAVDKIIRLGIEPLG